MSANDGQFFGGAFIGAVLCGLVTMLSPDEVSFTAKHIEQITKVCDSNGGPSYYFAADAKVSDQTWVTSLTVTCDNGMNFTKEDLSWNLQPESKDE